MSFGRSNSLSLNTNAVNNSFLQQQNPQPSAAGGLFGGSIFGTSNQAQKPAMTGTGMFGSQATTQQPAQAGLFGAAQPAQTGGLFGGQTQQTQTGGGLFGGQTTNQPSQTGGGLFGGQSTSQPSQNGGGLFGAQTMNQPLQTGGLFGSQNTAQPTQTGGLFGSQTATQPAQGTGLFGSTMNQNANSSSLFGGQQTQPAGASLFAGQQTQPAGSSLFGGSLFSGQPNQAKPMPAQSSLFGAAQSGGSLFGQSQNPAQQNVQQPSLLGASRYTAGQPAPFTGRLTMGQGSAAQATSTPATKLDWANVRPTTRYSDLVDSAKERLEQVDKMIQQQEMFSKQVEAFLPMHNTNLDSLRPDIDLIKDKCDVAEQALISDAQGIQYIKSLTIADEKDVLRCERIADNLRLPAQYHYAPAASSYGGRKNTSSDATLDEAYDMNLVNNYFMPMANDMQRLLESYSSNLSEIENHMSTIETSAVAQAHALSQQRTSGSGPDAVRQLADTLRAFESTILATAAKVGAAREGVTDVSLGRAHGLR